MAGTWRSDPPVNWTSLDGNTRYSTRCTAIPISSRSSVLGAVVGLPFQLQCIWHSNTADTIQHGGCVGHTQYFGILLPVPHTATCPQLAFAPWALKNLTDMAHSKQQANTVPIDFPLRMNSAKMQLRKWPKLAYPIFVWTTFCLLFISTLADPQTQTVSTGTSVNADALVSVIAVAESLRAASSDELLIGSSIPATPTSNGLLIGTATLTAGGPQYTTESYTISLGQSGILEVNGQTTSLPPGVPATQTTEAGEFTIGSNIIATRASTNAVHIGTATLTAGGPEITTSTYTLSLGPSGILDVNSETTSLAPLIPVVQTTSSDTPQSVVTSTMTSAPPDVSTQIIHPPGISTNKWVTTSKDGESTVVPGIWCNSCAPGDDSGIVLVWNFPKLRFTEFDWPSFPGLGKFHLPCIQLFGVAVTDCPPPQSDEESGSEDGSDSKRAQTLRREGTMRNSC